MEEINKENIGLIKEYAQLNKTSEIYTKINNKLKNQYNNQSSTNDKKKLESLYSFDDFSVDIEGVYYGHYKQTFNSVYTKKQSNGNDISLYMKFINKSTLNGIYLPIIINDQLSFNFIPISSIKEVFISTDNNIQGKIELNFEYIEEFIVKSSRTLSFKQNLLKLLSECDNKDKLKKNNNNINNNNYNSNKNNNDENNNGTFAFSLDYFLVLELDKSYTFKHRPNKFDTYYNYEPPRSNTEMSYVCIVLSPYSYIFCNKFLSDINKKTFLFNNLNGFQKCLWNLLLTKINKQYTENNGKNIENIGEIKISLPEIVIYGASILNDIDFAPLSNYERNTFRKYSVYKYENQETRFLSGSTVDKVESPANNNRSRNSTSRKLFDQVFHDSSSSSPSSPSFSSTSSSSLASLSSLSNSTPTSKPLIKYKTYRSAAKLFSRPSETFSELSFPTYLTNYCSPSTSTIKSSIEPYSDSSLFDSDSYKSNLFSFDSNNKYQKDKRDKSRKKKKIYLIFPYESEDSSILESSSEPSSVKIESVTIYKHDLKRQGEGHFFNDSLIDFHLKYLHHESLNNFNFFVFNTFFFTRISEAYRNKSLLLFDKDFYNLNKTNNISIDDGLTNISPKILKFDDDIEEYKDDIDEESQKKMNRMESHVIELINDEDEDRMDIDVQAEEFNEEERERQLVIEKEMKIKEAQRIIEELKMKEEKELKRKKENFKTFNSLYNTVSKWVKKPNYLIFKEYILIPINLHHHWSLIVIVSPRSSIQLKNPQDLSNTDEYKDYEDTFLKSNYGNEYDDVEKNNRPFILHMDSLNLHPTEDISELIIGYLYFQLNSELLTLLPNKAYKNTNLALESNNDTDNLREKVLVHSYLPQDLDEFKKKFKIIRCKVNQQTNGYDCGLYTILFASHVIRNFPLSSIQSPWENKKENNEDMSDYFEKLIETKMNFNENLTRIDISNEKINARTMLKNIISTLHEDFIGKYKEDRKKEKERKEQEKKEERENNLLLNKDIDEKLKSDQEVEEIIDDDSDSDDDDSESDSDDYAEDIQYKIDDTEDILQNVSKLNNNKSPLSAINNIGRGILNSNIHEEDHLNNNENVQSNVHSYGEKLSEWYENSTKYFDTSNSNQYLKRKKGIKRIPICEDDNNSLVNLSTISNMDKIINEIEVNDDYEVIFTNNSNSNYNDKKKKKKRTRHINYNDEDSDSYDDHESDEDYTEN